MQCVGAQGSQIYQHDDFKAVDFGLARSSDYAIIGLIFCSIVSSLRTSPSRLYGNYSACLCCLPFLLHVLVAVPRRGLKRAPGRGTKQSFPSATQELLWSVCKARINYALTLTTREWQSKETRTWKHFGVEIFSSAFIALTRSQSCMIYSRSSFRRPNNNTFV